MNKAVEAVKQHVADYKYWVENHDPTDPDDKFKKLGFRHFAKLFDVPFPTLYDRCRNDRGQLSGRPCKLNEEEELAVVDFLEYYCAAGLPCTEEKVIKNKFLSFPS